MSTVMVESSVLLELGQSLATAGLKVGDAACCIAAGQDVQTHSLGLHDVGNSLVVIGQQLESTVTEALHRQRQRKPKVKPVNQL